MTARDILKLLKALNDPTRLRILQALSVRRLCVCELRWALKTSQPLMSQHLRILRDAGLVRDIKKGLWVEYELAKREHDRRTARILNAVLAVLKNDPFLRKEMRSVGCADRETICCKQRRRS